MTMGKHTDDWDYVIVYIEISIIGEQFYSDTDYKFLIPALLVIIISLQAGL